jgi:hypothetical protein
METLKLTAYHKWLIERSGGDIDVLALRIYFDARDQNQMAFELLELTGDKAYTRETFVKAAKMLIENQT